MASEDRLRELEEKYEDYKVYDNQGSKIGKVDDLFIDEADHEEYIGVKLGLFGMRSTLIPMDIVRVNETDRTIEVSETKDRVKDAPNFDDDDDITTEYEERIRSHFGLETSSSSRGSYGASSTDSAGGAAAGAVGGAATGAAAGSSTGETREHGATDDDETRTAEHETTSTADDTGRSNRPANERTEDHETSDSSADEPSRDADSAQGSGSGGSTLGEGETQGTPVSRQTEETETFEEDGRTKIRRRIVREEVEDADAGTNRSE